MMSHDLFFENYYIIASLRHRTSDTIHNKYCVDGENRTVPREQSKEYINSEIFLIFKCVDHPDLCALKEDNLFDFLKLKF